MKTFLFGTPFPLHLFIIQAHNQRLYNNWLLSPIYLGGACDARLIYIEGLSGFFKNGAALIV